ncbi:MAG TPA: DUF58 domain-containing protein [Gaiellaceae bacterium]
MTRTVSRRAGVYALTSALALLLGLVLGSPALAALGAAFAAWLAVAFACVRAPEATVTLTCAVERAVEGERVPATLEVSSHGAGELELLLTLSPGIALAQGAPHLILAPGDGPRSLPLVLVAERWGAYRLGEIVVRARDRFGLVAFHARTEPGLALRVYPRPERLPRPIRPLETQPYAGNQVARVKGDGIEFADIRPFVRGDRVRRINWRASARRGETYVNEAHPERNSDVVLFLDSFAEVRAGAGGTLDRAVRAAASLARAYLDRRDRVGLVGFGGVVRWLTPSTGRTQLYRIVDALLETEVALSYAWKGIDLLPPRSLPPQSLVVALTPLLDERSVLALLDLRARGFDLVVVDVSPLPFAAVGGDDLDRLALRLWPLWREALRHRYERLGVAVVEWTDRPLAEAIEEVRSFRRYARRASG